MSSFNILHEPWLPVAGFDGMVSDVSLLEALAHAHDLGELRDPSPAIQYGLYRLLIAFVVDALGLDSLEDLGALLERRRFPADRLEAYAAKCGPVFDLHDPKRPFLQSADGWEDAKSEPIARLMQQLPTGTFATLFQHRHEDDYGLAPGSALNAIAAISVFMTAGGAGYSPSINGDPPWYVLIRGRNLFETLVLNSPVQPLPVPRGMPPWRSGRKITAKEEVSKFTLLEGLTWRPRRVRLLWAPADQGGICSYHGRFSPVRLTQMYFEAGLKAADGAATWVDPAVPYRTTEKGRFPLRLEEGRPLWRDIGPLALLRHKDYTSGKVRFERPLLVSQFRQLQDEGYIDAARPLQMECYAIRTDGKMKIFEWQRETLTVPADILAKPDAGRQVQEAMDQAQSVHYYLSDAIKHAYPREGKGNRVAFERVVVAARFGYWSVLQPLFEGEFMRRLQQQEALDPNAQAALAAWWRQTIQAIGKRVLDAALDELDADAEAICRQVAARDQFYFSLRKLDPNNPKRAKAKPAMAGKEQP